MTDAYITRISSFLPNKPVSIDDMEDYLGLINGQPSKSRKIVLRNNGIKTRHYALDKSGRPTHSNAELAASSIRKLLDDDFMVNDIELLSCGTSSPDQLLPSHATMVHGKLGGRPIETMAAGGACNAGMSALKYGYLSVISGDTNNAVCVGSEKLSSWLSAKNFEKEANKIQALNEKPFIAFEKDFLRWMLSDGAGSVLVENKPAEGRISLKIEWIAIRSYANEVETCMYAGAEKDNRGELIPWRDFDSHERENRSVFSLKQDIKLLEENILKYGVRSLAEIKDEYNFRIEEIDYFLVHLSSMFFKDKTMDAFSRKGMHIPSEKWFLNLPAVGNIGSASVYVMLEELFNSGVLRKGQKILLMVPESARFSYALSWLTVT
ncbi:MAG: beta-ketoacyl-ACP synthase III [Thermodesulfobacteriota bacterium]|nr:beta-ketoacyl-ACP synthase III [Thermodesulfobacteriota bacterium]